MHGVGVKRSSGRSSHHGGFIAGAAPHHGADGQSANTCGINLPFETPCWGPSRSCSTPATSALLAKGVVGTRRPGGIPRAPMHSRRRPVPHSAIGCTINGWRPWSWCSTNAAGIFSNWASSNKPSELPIPGGQRDAPHPAGI